MNSFKYLGCVLHRTDEDWPAAEHWEGKKSLGALGEVAEEVGSRPNSCRKVRPSSVPGGASFQGRNMGLDGNDAAKTGGVKRGFFEAGGRYVCA